jgi:tRNA-specific 2-thiouridylase
MARKIVAAMSGGVDSAVAAYLLKEQGFDVIGITLRLAPESTADARSGRCCSLDDMSDARLVCDKIGIPFYAIDAQAKFKETVFDPFVRAYQNGITPIPCLACNHTVKFGDLFATAKKLGAGLATGHYARMVDYRGARAMARPHDLDRDQTYYLYGTDPSILDELYFPLGELPKPEVRAIARAIGLLVHDKKDSHEICFVPDGDHARVVEKVLGKQMGGDIVDEEGKKVGSHDGVHRFTIGQRRGLGVSAKERLFVADIDAAEQRVVLAGRDALQCRNVLVHEFSYLIPREKWPSKVAVKIRARSPAAVAAVVAHDDTSRRVQFQFDEPALGVALGQAAVVYDGDVMLGGGILMGRLDGAFPRTMRQ